MSAEGNNSTKLKRETPRRKPRLVQNDNKLKLIWKSLDLEGQSAQIEADSRSIFIGNVAFDISPGILEEHFSGCGGSINRITLVKDNRHSSNAGYGYLEFDSIEARDKALSLDRSMIGGTRMIVRKKRVRHPLEEL